MQLINVIRALVLYIFNFLVATMTVLSIIVVYPLSKQKIPFKLAQYWGAISAFQGRLFCGMRYDITGRENIPDEPVVFMVKHQSAWETTALTGILPPSCFVVKASLLKIPVYGWGIRALRYIPINREANIKAFKQVLKDGKERISRGLSIIIFPEGTRIAPGEHPQFLKSGASLAKSAGCKVVPIALNSGSCWKRNAFIKQSGLIRVVIGQPIKTKGRSADEINNEAYEWIKSQMLTIEKASA